MATLTEVRNKANTKLADMWSKIQTREAAYFALHGKYFQFLVGSALTQDGADTPFSAILAPNEPYKADIDTTWSETVPFQLEVHEWVAPTKRGYTALVEIKHDQDTYRRERTSENVDSGWVKLIPTN